MDSKLIIISGPSRSGKDSIISALLQDKSLKLKKIITYTSRPKREDEQESVDHFFISKEKFEEMIKNDLFLEWAPVRNYYFGTPKREFTEALQSGENVLLKIDVRGWKILKEKLKNVKSISIFLQPGDFADLEKRLKKDNVFSDEQIKIRLTEAKSELKCVSLYNYVVTNYDGKLEQTINKVKNILKENA